MSPRRSLRVPAAATGEAAVMSEAAKRVPAHLLERSRLGRARYNANKG